MSYITGFIIRNQRNGGCRLGYIAHCDPQGKLPPWLVNKVTHSLGPRMVKDLRKAAQGYKKWKSLQEHNRKPWRFPEEIITPRLSISDVSISHPIIFFCVHKPFLLTKPTPASATPTVPSNTVANNANQSLTNNRTTIKLCGRIRHTITEG